MTKSRFDEKENNDTNSGSDSDSGSDANFNSDSDNTESRCLIDDEDPDKTHPPAYDDNINYNDEEDSSIINNDPQADASKNKKREDLYDKFIDHLVGDMHYVLRRLVYSKRLSPSDNKFISRLATRGNKLVDSLKKENSDTEVEIIVREFLDDGVELCQKSVVDDPGIDLFRRAILGLEANFNEWPTMETIGDLVNAQQKREFLEQQIEQEKERIERSCNKNPTNKISRLKQKAYELIIDHIEQSDPSLTLSKLLMEDSLYMKTVMYEDIEPYIDEKTGKVCTKKPYIDEETGKVCTIESVLDKKSSGLDSWASRPDSKKALGRMRLQLAEINPYTVLSVANAHRLSPRADDDDYAKKVWHIYTELAAHYKSYKQHGKRTHRVEFKKLLDDIKFLTQNSDDHERNYRLILGRLEEAFVKQERAFTKPFFPFLKGESKADFEKKLDKNNNEYTYPRALRKILQDANNAEEFDPFNLPPDVLTAALANTTSGQKIMKGEPVFYGEKPDQQVRFLKPIYVGEDNQFYLVSGKNKEETAEKSTHHQVKEVLKFQIHRNDEDGSVKVVVDPASWVKKSVTNKNSIAAQKEMKAIKKCIPDIQPPSRLFKNNIKQQKHGFFFVEKIEGITLEDIIRTSEYKEIIKTKDIFYIFRDLLAQAAFALSNGYIIFNIKTETINYNVKFKKATIVSYEHGILKDYDVDKDSIQATPSHLPSDSIIKELNGEQRMIYQIGLALAEFIIGYHYQYTMEIFRRQKIRGNGFINYFKSACEAMSIPPGICELIKGMMLTPDQSCSLQDMQQMFAEAPSNEKRTDVKRLHSPRM